MRKFRVVSVLLCIALALSLAACSTVTVTIPAENYGGLIGLLTGNSAAPAATEAAATTAPSPETTAAPVTDAPVTTPGEDPAGTTAAPSPAAETTTAAPSPAAETTTAAPAASAMPSTKDEIIKYYVTAYNKISSEAKTITRTYDYTSQYNNILEINNNSTLESLAKTLMNQFMKENTTPEDGDISKLPPVGVTTLSISPNQIGAANIEDKGTYYELKLTSTGTDDNWEVDPQPGSGSAGVIGPLLRADDVTGAAGSFIKFEGLHSWVGAATVTAKIDKATGHITDLDYLTPSVLHFDQVTAAVVVKVANCNIGLLFHQTWTVAY